MTEVTEGWMEGYFDGFNGNDPEEPINEDYMTGYDAGFNDRLDERDVNESE